MRQTPYYILYIVALTTWLLWSSETDATTRIGYRELSDSLTEYAGFNTIAVPKVKVKSMRVNGNHVRLNTNATMSYLSLTHDELQDLKRSVSRWVLGHERGVIQLYTDGYEISELGRYIPAKAQPMRNGQGVPTDGSSLSGRRIALWGSHGIYHDSIQQRWHWQRATLWTTVEDLYSSQYSRLVTEMLRNAGAEVVQPRGQIGDSAAMTIGESGYPRWAEAARYWLAYTGVPDSIWRDTHLRMPNHKPDDKEDAYRDDIRCRPFWVNWLSGGSSANPHEAGQGLPIDLCLALHTDGSMYPSDTLLTGTLVIYSDKGLYGETTLGDGRDRHISRGLADMVQTQLTADLRHLYTAAWPRRELKNSGYFEAKANKVPTLLLELLSHQSMADMQYGLNPAFQFDAARAIYKGIGRWLQGSNFVPAPLAPSHVALRLDDEHRCHVSWTATTDSLEPDATAKEFVVEGRVVNGEGLMEKGTWHEVWRGKKTNARIAMEHDKVHELRVRAVNKGGRSFPSEVYAIVIQDNDSAPVALVVNDFHTVRGPRWFSDSTYAGIVPGSDAIPDGIDYSYIGTVNDFRRSSQWLSDEQCGWGNCYRDHATEGFVGNTHDFPTRYVCRLIEQGYSVVSADSRALDSLQSHYDHIYLIRGREETPYQGNLLRQGVPLTISGSHEGSIPQACHSGVIITRDGQTLRYATQPNGERLHAPAVSAFRPNSNEEVVARYRDTGLPACVRDTVTQVTRWGVPLEAMIDD